MGKEPFHEIVTNTFPTFLKRAQPTFSPVVSTTIADDPYMTSGGLAYGILCTMSLFLMIILAIIYGRLARNRVFVYFCLSLIMLYIPHILGAWIYGANLNRAPTAVCWVQALWINASGISAGITVLIYAYEIYRNIVKQRVTEGEWKRRKYYLTMSVVFPVLVGIVPPLLIADKPDGIVVANLFFARKGFDPNKSTTPRTARDFDLEASTPPSNGSSVTMSHEESVVYEDLSSGSFTRRVVGRIPIYICLRLVLFLVTYCAMIVLLYGRSLVVNLKQDELSVKEPKYIEYIVASLGIIIFLIFGTSLEACAAYLRFLKVIFNFNWLKRCFGRDDSFGDWEVTRKKREVTDTPEPTFISRGATPTKFATREVIMKAEEDKKNQPLRGDDYLTIIRQIPPVL
ncbi:5469_t:CDS:2 [Acaulospora colombiana]|uniref:5469_t:CDS:1 n=1 Tax=Acaulospora colombiana TaxID=27376 RepID=A0ACA9JZ67_9GLOM|nr:5469_t:CDS:2 [Acaulospora colombiana]